MVQITYFQHLELQNFIQDFGVYDFVKYSSYSYYPRDILKSFKDDVIKFANIEGLDAHANSIKVRFER